MRPAATALTALETQLQACGALVIQAIRGALVAVEDWDPGILDYVGEIGADIDQHHRQIERDIAELLARHAPVASDLRVVLATLRVSLHLERIGHNCTRLTRLAAPTGDGPLPAELVPLFVAALARGGEMTRTALDALALRDEQQAATLPDLDEAVDRDTAAILMNVIDGGAARFGHEASARALFAARCVERIGDHAVEIAEQASYLVTGEFADLGAHAPDS